MVVPRSKSEIAGTGTSPTLSEPPGAKNGDVIVGLILCDTAGAPVRPPGWQPTPFRGIQGAVAWDVSLITRGEVAPSLTWALTGSVYREVFLCCAQSLNGEGPIVLHALSAAGAKGNSSNKSPDPSPVTVTLPSLNVAFGLNFGGAVGAGSWTPSAGYANQTSGAAALDAVLETKSILAAGIEDPGTITTGVGTANDWWDGGSIALTDSPLIVPSYASSPVAINKRVPLQQQRYEG